MQNQVNMNQVSMNVETSSTTNQPQFIIQGIPAIQGGVVNLAELLNKANAGEMCAHTHTEPFSISTSLVGTSQLDTVVAAGHFSVLTTPGFPSDPKMQPQQISCHRMAGQWKYSVSHESASFTPFLKCCTNSTAVPDTDEKPQTASL